MGNWDLRLAGVVVVGMILALPIGQVLGQMVFAWGFGR